MADEIGTFSYHKDSDVREISELIEVLRDSEYLVSQHNNDGKFTVKMNRNQSLEEFEEEEEDEKED